MCLKSQEEGQTHFLVKKKKLLLGQTIYSHYKETNPFTKDRTLID